MPGDARDETARFTAVMAVAYNVLHEASVGLAVAAQMRPVPPDPEALQAARGSLERTRRLLHTCLMYIDTIERTALDLDEDDPDLP